jgi:hypothetical protein
MELWCIMEFMPPALCCSCRRHSTCFCLGIETQCEWRWHAAYSILACMFVLPLKRRALVTIDSHSAQTVLRGMWNERQRPIRHCSWAKRTGTFDTMAPLCHSYESVAFHMTPFGSFMCATARLQWSMLLVEPCRWALLHYSQPPRAQLMMMKYPTCMGDRDCNVHAQVWSHPASLAGRV